MIFPEQDGTTYLIGDSEVTYCSELSEWMICRGEERAFAPFIAITVGGLLVDFEWDEPRQSIGMAWCSW